MTEDGRGPLRSGPFAIRPEWIDANGHLNLAHYITLFDEATDVLWVSLGLGDAFRAGGYGTFAAETHTLYRAELLRDDRALIDSQLIAVDAKRLHVAHTMRRASDDQVSALQELLYLCVDLGTRRVAPWPGGMHDSLERAVAADERLPRPDWIGRAVAMPARPSPNASTRPGAA